MYVNNFCYSHMVRRQFYAEPTQFCGSINNGLFVDKTNKVCLVHVVTRIFLNFRHWAILTKLVAFNVDNSFCLMSSTSVDFLNAIQPLRTGLSLLIYLHVVCGPSVFGRSAPSNLRFISVRSLLIVKLATLEWRWTTLQP